MEMTRVMSGRRLACLGLAAAAISAYLPPLWALFRFAWGDDTFSYIPLIPLVSGWLFYENRRTIFSSPPRWNLAAGAPLVPAIVLYALSARDATSAAQGPYLVTVALSFVCFSVGGLGLIYGPSVWKRAAFPIFFLVFMIPIPNFLLDRIVRFLQAWSADAADFLFGFTGVPFNRDGFLFHLPGMSIEVAEQCSGIRSSISLFLVSLLAGNLMLKDSWRKVVATLSIIPITVVKNGVRIVTLTLLGVYVDPRILGSIAHRRGGVAFFVLALGLFGGVLWLLRLGERNDGARQR